MDAVKGVNLHPWIETQLREIKRGDLELNAGGISFKDVTSSSHLTSDDSTKNDTFTICIPYAGSKLHWQVLFDGSNCEELPDFLISDVDGFDPDYDDIPALIDWDPKDPASLLNVLRDILKLFRLHQMNVIEKTEDGLAEGLNRLLSSQDFPVVETLVTKEEDPKYGTPQQIISMLIQIRIDLTDLPEVCFQDAPPRDPGFPHPVLFIKTVANSGKIRPSLYMAPDMEHILGGRNAMKLPPFHPQNTILLDYVQLIQSNLQSVINVLKEGHTRRREYVAAFLYQCADSVLEYDAAEFNSISLLYTYEDFHFIVHVSLNRFFPLEQPKFILQSVYHMTRRGASYQVVHSNYPYSPRWHGSEMVKRARTYILEQIDSFKVGCLKNGIV